MEQATEPLDTLSTEDGHEVFSDHPFDLEEAIDTLGEDLEIPPPHLLASFRKTSCYGQCPAFHYKLFSDGRAIYHGKQNVDKLGYYEASVQPELIHQVRSIINEYEFFDLAEQYPEDGNFLADLPSVITHFRIDGQEMTITNNYDCPKQLIDLEKAIQAFFENLEWRQLVRKR